MASWLLRSRPGLVALIFVLPPAVLVSTTGEAYAHPSGPPAVSAEAQADAQRHFRAAQDYYQQGAYSETIAELKMAVSLDPAAKDLYYNLGIVHEKVDDIDAALEYFRKYETFDLDQNEKGRVEKVIRRLEGAKAQRKAGGTAPAPTTTPSLLTQPLSPVATPAVPEASPAHGRVDALTWSAAGATIVSLGVGIGFGISALTSKPKDGYVTGQDGTYADLEAATKSAHDKGVVADVAFVAAGAFAVTTGILYFARTKDPTPRAEGPTLSRVGVVPSAGGAALMLGGAF